MAKKWEGAHGNSYLSTDEGDLLFNGGHQPSIIILVSAGEMGLGQAMAHGKCPL